MGADFLVSTELEAAADLVAWLDQAGFPVAAAFWALEGEGDEERWRFYLATEHVRKGPMMVYGELAELMDRAPNRDDLLDLDRIRVVGPDHPIVRAVSSRELRGTRRPLRIRGTFSEGTYVPDAIVYRNAA